MINSLVTVRRTDRDHVHEVNTAFDTLCDFLGGDNNHLDQPTWSQQYRQVADDLTSKIADAYLAGAAIRIAVEASWPTRSPTIEKGN